MPNPDESVCITTLYGLISETCWLLWNARNMKFSRLWTRVEPWTVNCAITFSTYPYTVLWKCPKVYCSVTQSLAWPLYSFTKWVMYRWEQPNEISQHLVSATPPLIGCVSLNTFLNSESCYFIFKKVYNNATLEWHRTLNDCILISNEHVFQKGRANKNLICFTALICSVHKAKTEVVLVMGAV